MTMYIPMKVFKSYKKHTLLGMWRINIIILKLIRKCWLLAYFPVFIWFSISYQSSSSSSSSSSCRLSDIDLHLVFLSDNNISSLGALTKLSFRFTQKQNKKKKKHLFFFGQHSWFDVSMCITAVSDKLVCIDMCMYVCIINMCICALYMLWVLLNIH